MMEEIINLLRGKKKKPIKKPESKPETGPEEDVDMASNKAFEGSETPEEEAQEYRMIRKKMKPLEEEDEEHNEINEMASNGDYLDDAEEDEEEESPTRLYGDGHKKAMHTIILSIGGGNDQKSLHRKRRIL